MGYKILLADDSVTVQKIITLTFSDEGVDVITVNNGDEAINRLQYVRPALVMADVSIPGKNGYEICEFVKSHPEMKDTPVILLVPAFERFDEERARRIGADYHLTKPFQSIRTLISTVKDLAERKAGAEFSVIGSGLTAVRGSERNDFEINDFDPKRAKIDELIKISSEDQLETRMDDEVLLEIDLTRDKARYPASLSLTSSEAIEKCEAIETMDNSTDDAPYAQPSDSIDQQSAPSADVSSFAPPEMDLLDLDLDDVLELEDILPNRNYAPDGSYARGNSINESVEAFSASSPSPTLVENQAEMRANIQGTQGTQGTQGGIIIPQSVIDEIVSRVSARLSGELIEKLSGEIARRIAPQVAELIKSQIPAKQVAYRDSDNLLDID